MIDETFVKKLEKEYAVKYLEHLGIEANIKNIKTIVGMAPLKKCFIAPVWESSGEVASAVNVYPSGKNPISKAEGNSFDASEEKSPPNKSSSYMKDLNSSKNMLPPIARKYIESNRMEDNIEYEKSGIPKLTINGIKKRYLYPFSVDSNFLLIK